MTKLINKINISSIKEAEEILKSAGTEDLFEKAKHQDGDMHPNGKWVWVSSAAGGKGDWRTKGGRTHTKHSAGGNAGTGSKTTTQQNPTTAGMKDYAKFSESLIKHYSQKKYFDNVSLSDIEDDFITHLEDQGKNPSASLYMNAANEVYREIMNKHREMKSSAKVGDVSKTTTSVSEKKTESKTSTTTTPQMIRKESNRVNGNVEITYSSIPFVDDKNGNAKFVIKKTNNGNYYVPSSPFLGHETPDVKKRFDDTFYSPGSIEDIEGRIKTFITWLSKEHPYSALKDIKDFNEKSKVRTMVEMYRIKDNRSLRKTISNISSSDVDEIKKRILDEFNDAFDDNVKSDAVGYRFRVYK